MATKNWRCSCLMGIFDSFIDRFSFFLTKWLQVVDIEKDRMDDGYHLYY
jgi:hypothetical protein